jgi:hypothetical protein
MVFSLLRAVAAVEEGEDLEKGGIGDAVVDPLVEARPSRCNASL